MHAKIESCILVIDDDASVRESLRNYLEDLGHTVVEAADGREGLAQFEHASPSAVLVDLRMPEVDGFSVLEKMAATSPDTPVVVISGTGRISDAIRALHLGAWDYILKPVIDLSVVDHAVSKVLERARLLRENRDHQHELEKEVKRRTAELTKKMDEMARFNRMAVGRERRIIELKRVINDLLGELGREERFSSPSMLAQDTSRLT